MKRPAGSSANTPAYENFLYLLAELEHAIDRGTIPWSVSAAEAAYLRVKKISAELARIASKLRLN